MLSDGTSAINFTLVVMFLGLAVIAATVIMITGKVMYGKWYSWLALFGSALLGGISGVAILWFGAAFEEVRADQRIDSITSMVEMAGALLLIMMIALPLCTIILRHRRKKIRELEKEIEELKKQQA